MQHSSLTSNYSVSNWWHDVRLLANPFFQLIRVSPLEDVHRPLELAMVELYQARQRVEHMESPDEASTVRQHLLSAMRKLQISLADALADQWEDSETFYQEAYGSYEIITEMMKKYRVAA